MDMSTVVQYLMKDVDRLKDDVKSQGEQMRGLKEEILKDMHNVVKSAVSEAMEGKKC